MLVEQLSKKIETWHALEVNTVAELMAPLFYHKVTRLSAVRRSAVRVHDLSSTAPHSRILENSMQSHDAKKK